MASWNSLVFIEPCDMENNFEFHLTYIHHIPRLENRKKKVENNIYPASRDLPFVAI